MNTGTKRLGRRLALVACATVTTPLAAQGPPGSDIFVASLAIRDGRAVLGQPVNVTERAGYDNQPFFLPDGSAIYYTSYRNGQADVYRYDLATGKHTQLTDTPESEYSPTPMPEGRRFSVVRVEADSTQRLWTFALDGSDARLLIPSVAPVGYHAWLTQDVVALFVLGTPNTLQIVHLSAGRPDTIAENVGRSLVRVPGSSQISFVQRTADGEGWVTRQDTASTVHRIVRLPGDDYFASTPDGTLFSANGSSIYWYRPELDESWVEIADFSAAAIGGITRIAVSPRGDRIAFVAADPPGNR